MFCLATQPVDTETWGKPPSELNTIDGGNYFCAGLMHYSQTPQIQTFAAVQSNTVMYNICAWWVPQEHSQECKTSRSAKTLKALMAQYPGY